jgi:hypothetical protein
LHNNTGGILAEESILATLNLAQIKPGLLITVTQNGDFGTRFFGKLRRDEGATGRMQCPSHRAWKVIPWARE